MNSRYTKAKPLYSLAQICAGKNCINEGKHQLTILYLNKRGCFCESCRHELLNDGLIVQQEDE